ncbi:MAG: class I SAM-dependent methyltransferase [Steroidobacteraceae bacterium]
MSKCTCTVCNSSDLESFGSFSDEEYFTRGATHTYWRCKACGCVFLHPLPIARLAEIYPANYYSYDGGGRGFLDRIKGHLDAGRLRRCLRRINAGRLSVLDVGGGSGWMLDLVRRMDPRVAYSEVVDLDAAASEAARSRGHVYSRVRIEEFESPRRFDFILLLNLIEHVESPHRVLKRLGGMLAPGGLILVKTPNHDSWDARLFGRSYWAGLHVPRHWTVFHRQSFERVLERTGLAVDEFSYTQGGAFWAASILAALNRRGWVRLSDTRPAVSHPAFPVLAGLTAALDYLRLPFAPTSQMFITLRKTS